jgi:hypothetical protein
MKKRRTVKPNKMKMGRLDPKKKFAKEAMRP